MEHHDISFLVTNKSNNDIDAYVLFITSQRPEERSPEGIKVELIININI